MINSKKERFYLLDSLRGVAALMVMIYHLKTSGFVTELNIVRNSYLFVEFFFVLSGFVIGHTYLNKPVGVNKIDHWKLFIKKRFSRIWPLHIFVTILFIPFALSNIFLNLELGERFSFYSFLTNIFLVQSLNLNSGMSWNVPAWSISAEFYTYAIFGILYLSSQIRGSFLFPIILSIASLFILFNYSTMGDFHHLAIFRCFYSFFLGVSAFNLYRSFRVSAWMEVVAVIFILIILTSTRIEPSDTLAFVMPLFFFVLIMIFSKQCGQVSKLLINPCLQTLGLLSFSIYLTHTWFISLIKAVSKITEKMFDYKFIYTINNERVIDFNVQYLNDLIYLPYIALVIGASYLTYWYIEKPSQEKLNSLLIKK